MKKEWWWALGAGAAAFGSAYWFLSRYPTEQRLRSEAEELLERGHRFVEDGDLTRALRVGERLLARRYTGGYELVARVFFERGRLAEAIEVLGKRGSSSLGVGSVEPARLLPLRGRAS